MRFIIITTLKLLALPVSIVAQTAFLIFLSGFGGWVSGVTIALSFILYLIIVNNLLNWILEVPNNGTA